MIKADNDNEIKVVFTIDQGVELPTATGFRKPFCSLALTDRPPILSALMDYHLIMEGD